MSRFYTNAFVRSGKVHLKAVEDGKRIRVKSDAYQPYLFVPAKNPDAAEYKTVFGKPVDKKIFSSIKEAKDWLERYSGVYGFEYFGMTDFVYPFLNDYFPGEVVYDKKHLNIGNIDIEVGSDEGFPDVADAVKPITAITVQIGDYFYAFGCDEFVPGNDYVVYTKCRNESELISKFLDAWEIWDLDVVTGWYIDFFDIPYLINRITRVFNQSAAKRLSPWGIMFERKTMINGKQVEVFTPAGVAILDYQRMYKKFVLKPQESYSLNHICSVEIGEKKMDFSEHESLFALYKNDFQKFMEYNVRDVALVSKLDDKLGLIDLALTVAYDAKINIDQVFGPVKMWDVIIHNYMLDRKMVIPPFEASKKPEEFLGAYVKDPQRGMHEWVTSFDINSLYPSLIVQYNISPETYAGKPDFEFSVDDLLDGTAIDAGVEKYLLDHDLTMAANATIWSKKKQGIIPEIVEKFLKDRKVYKGIMQDAKRENALKPSIELDAKISRYHNLQNTRKVQLNSFYGALGNQYFRWFKIEFAEAITKTGQYVIRYVEKGVNSYLNKLLKTSDTDFVVAIDTDSNYIRLGEIVKKFILVSPEAERIYDKPTVTQFVDQFCKHKLEPEIDRIFAEFAEKTQAFKSFLQMKREVIADRALWKAKKAYVLHVWDDEGVTAGMPKLKMVGIEAIKSSTPLACREKLKEAIKLVMTSDNGAVLDLVDDFREKFKKLSFNEIGFSVGVNNMDTYSSKNGVYRSGCPMNVRAALLFNYHIRRLGLDDRYQVIHEGDKIKYVFLNEPNPINENVIAGVVGLPKQLGLDPYIDYRSQFNKVFLDPLRNVLEPIGWTAERISTLEEFFA